MTPQLIEELPPNSNVSLNCVLGRTFQMVSDRKTFTFKKLCPYCGGDLSYTATEWEKQDDGTWTAISFDVDCSTEPDIESDEWTFWIQNHEDMPYVYQLPVDMAVTEYIESKYRFEIKESAA